MSRRGWAQEFRRSLNTQLYPAFNREEFEEKQRRVDQMEEEAEELFSREIDRWRHDPSPQAKEVLSNIYEILKGRTDLGFFAKRIVERLRREFKPF